MVFLTLLSWKHAILILTMTVDAHTKKVYKQAVFIREHRVTLIAPMKERK